MKNENGPRGRYDIFGNWQCDDCAELRSQIVHLGFRVGTERKALARRAFEAGRMAFRTVEPMKEVPGLMRELGGDACFLYEDFSDWWESEGGK